jgi:hypothetical protein
MTNLKWAFEIIIMPIVISYLSVYLDQLWHAKRDFGRTYARTIAIGRRAEEMPEKMTIDALFDATVSELRYTAELCGRHHDQVYNDLMRDFPNSPGLAKRYLVL